MRLCGSAIETSLRGTDGRGPILHTWNLRTWYSLCKYHIANTSMSRCIVKAPIGFKMDFLEVLSQSTSALTATSHFIQVSFFAGGTDVHGKGEDVVIILMQMLL